MSDGIFDLSPKDRQMIANLKDALDLVREREIAQGKRLHPDTVTLVDEFAAAMKAKLLVAQQKYGYRNGWLTEDWQAECQAELLRHVGKGDPLDVAAYAAFCWARGWSTALENGPAALADATNDPASTDLSSLRKGAEELRRSLICVKQQCETAVFNISQREHDEAVVRSFQSIADYCARALVSGSREDGADA